LKYKNKIDAQGDHIKNYRSDGLNNGKGTYLSRDYMRFLWVMEKTPEGSIVLDIGCNTGIFSIPLQTEKKCYVRGIDVVPEIVEIAKKRGVRAEVGEAENLSQFGDKKFDTVLCCEVLEHLYNPFDAIAEAWRVLKKGGIMLVTIPHPFSKICETLGDFHHQNFTAEKIYNVMYSRFKRDSVSYYEIPFVKDYCEKFGISPSAPQYLCLEAKK
tara:strand:+ start:810 stop:1448 length:639 start_codon:yes stop_codon:yes gene_type:complete